MSPWKPTLWVLVSILRLMKMNEFENEFEIAAERIFHLIWFDRLVCYVDLEAEGFRSVNVIKPNFQDRCRVGFPVSSSSPDHVATCGRARAKGVGLATVWHRGQLRAWNGFPICEVVDFSEGILQICYMMQGVKQFQMRHMCLSAVQPIMNWVCYQIRSAAGVLKRMIGSKFELADTILGGYQL